MELTLQFRPCPLPQERENQGQRVGFGEEVRPV